MKIRVGVVGAGTYGLSLIHAFYAKHALGEIDLVAVADLREDALRKVRETYSIKGYTDYRAMLDQENLDAVAVVTPDHLHREITLAAAERGIHLLVQKPIATSSEDGRRMIAAAAQNNVMLYVDFHKRFDPGHIQLRRAVREGRLGSIEYGYVCMEDKILVPTEWFKTWAQHSSPVWFLGVHFYDLLYWILGEMPVQALASGHKRKLKSLGIDSYDSISARFLYAGGAAITVDASWIMPNSFSSVVNQQIRLVGTDGMQEVDSQDRGVVACYAEDALSHVINPYGNSLQPDPVIGEAPTGYTIESMQYFLRLASMIKDGRATLESLKSYYPDGEEALAATLMAEAVHRSVESGKIEPVG